MEIFIHIPFEKRQTNKNIFATGLSDLKESFGFILKKQPVLWKVSLIYSSTNLFFTSLVLIGVPVIITQRLGFPLDTANRLYGYAQGIIVAGCVLGGFLAGLLSNKLTLKTSPFILAGCALSMLLGGIALQTLSAPMANYIIMLIGCALLLVLSTLFQIQIMTYLQILTPKELTGKVISCVMCVCMCTNPLGQFIYGIVFENIGSSTYLPFYVAVSIMIIISIFTRPIFYGMDLFVKEQTGKKMI
jgi:MFS family permease